MYPCCYYLPSNLTLLTLHYGGCVERSRVAWERAKEEGISFRESEQMADSEVFLDRYPWWGLGTPHQSVVLHKMFLHAAGWGQKEAECMFHWGCWGSVPKPDPRADQSAMELVGYQTSRREMRDIYHSHVPLKEVPWVPLLQRVTEKKGYSGYTLLPNGLTAKVDIFHHNQKSRLSGGRVGWTGSIGILWSGSSGGPPEGIGDCQSLQSDIERLGSEWRRRSWVWSCSQSRIWSRMCSRHQSRTCSRGQSRNRARANSQSCSHGDLWHVHPWSPDEPPPKRRVSFHNPEDEEILVKKKQAAWQSPLLMI